MSKDRPLEAGTDIDITEITDISLVCGLSEGLRFLAEKNKLEEQKRKESESPGYHYLQDA